MLSCGSLNGEKKKYPFSVGKKFYIQHVKKISYLHKNKVNGLLYLE